MIPLSYVCSPQTYNKFYKMRQRFSCGPGVRPTGVPVLRLHREHGGLEVSHGSLRQGVSGRVILDVGVEGHQHGYPDR